MAVPQTGKELPDRANGAALVPAPPPFSQLFRDHLPFVWRVLQSHGVPEASLEDACQEVFVVVHRQLPGFQGRSSLKTWMYGICRNVASAMRKRAHARYEIAVTELPQNASSREPLEEMHTRELAHQLLSMLAQLSSEKREVFTLFEIEGFAMPEVAEAVGCNLSTAYSRLYAARREIEAKVARLHPQSEGT